MIRYLRAMYGAPAVGQFPAVTTWFQRLDATATYTFDKEAVALLGWKGEVKAKLITLGSATRSATGRMIGYRLGIRQYLARSGSPTTIRTTTSTCSWRHSHSPGRSTLLLGKSRS